MSEEKRYADPFHSYLCHFEWICVIVAKLSNSAKVLSSVCLMGCFLKIFPLHRDEREKELSSRFYQKLPLETRT